MSSTPYIALYPSDYLADTAHLGLLEHGVYWRLLLHYYQHGRPLPGDIDRIARIISALGPEEKRTLEYILAEFFKLENNPDGTRVWIHNRANREIQQAVSRVETLQNRARTAADARWHKQNNAKAMLEHCLDDANHNQNQNHNQNHNQNQIPPQPQAAGGERPEKSEGYPQAFLLCWEVWKTRLTRTGENPKQAAYRAWSARIKGGATEAELYEGTLRYADYCQNTGIAGSQFVKMASTFYGPQLFYQETYEIPANGKGANNKASLEESNRAAGKAWLNEIMAQQRVIDGDCHREN